MVSILFCIQVQTWKKRWYTGEILVMEWVSNSDLSEEEEDYMIEQQIEEELEDGRR